MNHIQQRADNQHKGMESEYYNTVVRSAYLSMTVEQLALMALISENGNFTDAQVHNFTAIVGVAQSLMPNGTIVSRQALVMLAMLAIH